MLIGAHTIIYSTKPEADRAFFRDVMKMPAVDVGEGWLIFGLPPSEVAVHPADKDGDHEFYLMCDDVAAFVTDMRKRRVPCSAAQDMGWGVMAHITLPGGGTLGVYEPRHGRPKSMAVASASKPASKAKKSSAKKPAAKARAKKPANKSAAKKTATKSRGKASAAKRPAAKKSAKKAKRR